MRRLLISGAGGFLGRNCLDVLAARDWKVHAADRRPLAAAPAEMQTHQIDILDRQDVSDLLNEIRPTHLLHLAWTGGRSGYESPENVRWVRGSMRLVEEFAAAGGERVVALGSCAEYEWGEEDCSEAGTPLGGDTVYGVCKSSLFRLFEAFCAASGLSGVWARPFFLFGPHESPARFVSSVITSLLGGEPARCTHGRQIRDYLYSREAAGALVHLLSAEFEGAVNVAAGSGVSLADVVQLIARRVGREDLVELGALAAPEGEAPRVVADIGRLRSEAGWRPTIGLEQGLNETIDWWRRELNL